MGNRLGEQSSPYLRQHRDNPVDWYPWGEEAFRRAAQEDKPVFLSIGYSTCHWCHVMAHESFEDVQIAEILNRHFISIKVDKEERPDIDTVYMAVCQAFTGSGGWPTTIFMTPEQKPFFAGTYFPPTARGGMIGLRELLLTIQERWAHDRAALLQQADGVLMHLSREGMTAPGDPALLSLAVAQYERIYDEKHGGFGRAPKFPAPHNILFLLAYYERFHHPACLSMAEHTLTQMYRGGLFDHIGFGFCRYSTDKRFLVPHFEKMLYDNALLILAYARAYAVTRKPLYLSVAEKTAAYILREMTAPEGGFYSAQDADSEREEGKYYLFTPDEIIGVLGPQDGAAFNRHYDINETGHFEGKSIPNLLKSDPNDPSFEGLLPRLQAYRKQRHPLHLDDKILTVWNGLMIAALCELYLVSGKAVYLHAAQGADACIQQHLCEQDTLFVSFREGTRGVPGFLDDYAAYLFAQLRLYRATLDRQYLERVERLYATVAADFEDPAGGFYLYSKESEELILRPKETYDGAIPSGNTLMAYNLVRLWLHTDKEAYRSAADRQLEYLAAQVSSYPTSYAMYLLARLEYEESPMKITVVPGESLDRAALLQSLPADAAVSLLPRPTEEYPLKNGQTTYYVCHRHRCLPPTNDVQDIR